MHKVLVDLHRVGQNKYNGLYQFCYQLGKHLSEMSIDDLDLYFYLPEGQQALFNNKVKYFFQHSRDKYFRPGTGKFTVWHVAITLSWYRPFNRKTKNVFTIHDLNFLDEEKFSYSNKKKYLRLIQQRIDRADYLTFISHFARQQAEKHLRLNDLPYKIIYNGCNKASLIDITEPTYKPERPFLFTIGQLHSRKNFHVLPALLTGNNYELIIAGLNDFPYTEKVKSEAKKHNVEERVRFIGPISEEMKYWYYQHCEGFLFPSIGEGFGLPVLEAMQFGKPVFLSAFTSLPEVGGEVAYYFDEFDPDAMRLVFEKGMNDYANNSRSGVIKQQAASFSWDKAAKDYLVIYRSLL